jgi:hypothetical protein
MIEFARNVNSQIEETTVLHDNSALSTPPLSGQRPRFFFGAWRFVSGAAQSPTGSFDSMFLRPLFRVEKILVDRILMVAHAPQVKSFLTSSRMKLSKLGWLNLVIAALLMLVVPLVVSILRQGQF